MLIYNFGDWTEWLEPQKVTFLGEEKLIVLHTEETSINAQIDLYSAWKEWIRYYDNAKWSAAFRTFGGDQTGENQYAPSYYFLINGWKVYAENMSVVVQTNLYSDDGLSPFIIDNAAVTNRASDVPVVQSSVERRLEYGDRIYFDATSSYVGATYPNGTIAQPVNNIPDAIALATLYNITNFYVLSDVDISDTGNVFEDYSIIAEREDLTINIVDGNYLNRMEWTGFKVNGYFGGGRNKFVDCVIDNVYDTSGQMKSCQINGNIRVWDSIVSSLCYSGIPGSNTPYWDMNSGRTTTLSIRSYSGGVELLNSDTSGCTATIELIAGQIILDPTCTDGYIDLRGVGYITDNSNGSTIKTTGFIDSFEEGQALNEHLAYQNTIYYDEINGVTGTTYPVGTSADPVNNIPDLYVLSEYTTNIKNIVCQSDFIVSGVTSILPPGQKMDNFTISADAPGINLYIYDDGIAENVKVKDFIIIEAHLGGLSNEFDNCNFHEIYGMSGYAENCGLFGEHDVGDIPYDHKIRIQENTTFVNCYPGESNSSPKFWLVNSGGTELSVRGWNGDITIDKVEHELDFVALDIVAGKITLTSGCTNGNIEIRGVGYLIDNSGTGCTVNTTGFVNSFESYIEETREIDELLAYNNKIYLDVDDGFSGTTYPIGTSAKPSNNLADTKTLASNLNTTEIELLSDIVLDTHLIGYSVVGKNADIDFNGQNVTGSAFDNCRITGEQSGPAIVCRNCRIDEINNLSGVFNNCTLLPTVKTFLNNGVHLFNDCYAGLGVPIFDFNGAKSDLGLRSYTGDIQIDNYTHTGNTSTIEFVAGNLDITSGCTGGVLDIRGVGYVTDNSQEGCTIKRDGQLQASPGEYNGVVVLDVVDGEAGVLFPRGTASFPVSNLADALKILNFYKLRTIHIVGTLTIDGGEDISSIKFTAERSTGNYLFITDAITDSTYIENLTTNVIQDGTCRYTTCVMLGVDNFDGGVKNSLLVGTIDITGGGSNYFTDCDTYTTNTSNLVPISINGNKLNMIRSRGFYKLLNKTGTDTTTIDMVAGIIEVDSTCTSGIIYIGGICEVIDNSGAGCTVINQALSRQTIEDSTWDATIADHVEPGTTGDALNNVSAGASPELIAQAVWNLSLSGFTSGTGSTAGEAMVFIVESNSAMTEQIYYLTEAISGITGDSGITTKIDIIYEDVKRILGLTQENFRIKDHVYDSNDNLESATIRIYNSSSDCDTDTSPLAQYSMDALYDGVGRLTSYKVTKN